MGKWTGLPKLYPAEYRAWQHMKKRCLNPKDQDFHLYGGRGVKVSPLWLKDFPRFLADMGPKPDPALTLDREDPEGNYEPGNCRWATVQQQAANRRYCHKVMLSSGEMTVQEAARTLGLPVMTYRNRVLKQGLTPEQAASRERVQRKDSRLIEFNGQTQTLPQWAKALGLRVRTLRERLRRGMPLERALKPL
jgi:hypothetical protein